MRMVVFRFAQVECRGAFAQHMSTLKCRSIRKLDVPELPTLTLFLIFPHEPHARHSFLVVEVR